MKRTLEFILCLLIIIAGMGLFYYIGTIQGREAVLTEQGTFKPRIDTTWIWTPK